MNDEQQNIVSPPPTVQPTDNFPPAADTKKGSPKKVPLIVLAVLVGLAGLGAAAYMLFFKQPTAQQLYRQSLENAVSVQSQDLFGSFDIDSGDTKVTGEFVGDLGGSESRLRADLSVSSESNGVPVSVAAEMISIGENDKSENYVRYKSVTSSNALYKPEIESYFAPTLNTWVKLAESSSETTTPTSFTDDGALAAFDALGIFAPVAQLSEADQQVFLSAVDKYNIYQVDEAIESTRYKGIEARKIKVHINKDAFTELEKELSEALSDEAEFEQYETAYVDQLFGKDNKLSADVYLSAKSATIIGVSMEVDLDVPIQESTFDTILDKINASVLIEYNRQATIEAPADTITEEMFNALLGS